MFEIVSLLALIWSLLGVIAYAGIKKINPAIIFILGPFVWLIESIAYLWKN